MWLASYQNLAITRAANNQSLTNQEGEKFILSSDHKSKPLSVSQFFLLQGIWWSFWGSQHCISSSELPPYLKGNSRKLNGILR